MEIDTIKEGLKKSICAKIDKMPDIVERIDILSTDTEFSFKYKEIKNAD